MYAWNMTSFPVGYKSNEKDTLSWLYLVAYNIQLRREGETVYARGLARPSLVSSYFLFFPSPRIASIVRVTRLAFPLEIRAARFTLARREPAARVTAARRSFFVTRLDGTWNTEPPENILTAPADALSQDFYDSPFGARHAPFSFLSLLRCPPLLTPWQRLARCNRFSKLRKRVIYFDLQIAANWSI